MSTIDVVDNPSAGRFEARVDGAVAGSAYYRRRRDGRYVVTHTEVDPQRQGQGIGQALAAGALDAVRAAGGVVVPQCPFIAGYIRRHPDYLDIVDTDSRPNVE